MVYWELEREPSDGQYDLFRDGAVFRHALIDEHQVAQVLQQEADDYDSIELPDGQVQTAGAFITQHG